MDFNNITVTYAGAKLLAYSDASKKATVVDSIIISSNTPANSVDYASLSFSDFGGYKEFPVVNIRHQDNVFQPEALVSNDNMTNPFPVIMIGLKAHTDGEQNDAIIAVAVGDPDSPFTIPALTSVPYKLYLDMPVGYSNSANVKMNINNAGMVTIEDVDQAITLAVATLETQSSHTADITSLASEINSVASAAGNNSGLSAEFTAVNTSISTNSSAIATLQTSVSTNSNAIGSLQTSVNSNSSSISTLQTSVSNNSTSIATNSNNVSSLVKSVANNSSNINSLSSNAMQWRGDWGGNFNSLASQPDGIYGIMGNTNGAPAWFDGYGIILKYHNDTDLIMQAIDNGGHSGTFSKFGNWIQNANESDLVNLQNNVNGVLARQSSLIQNMLNNSLYDINNGNTVIPINYNMSNNIITFGYYTVGSTGYISYGTISSYAISQGYSYVTFKFINGSSYNLNGIDINNNYQIVWNGGGTNVNGLQIQAIFH